MPAAEKLAYYDGPIYGRVVEPLLAGVHGFIAKRLPEGDRVLDACCGTGALVRRLAAAGRRVTGVDLSARSIEWARDASADLDPDRVEFKVADITDLDVPPEGPFDVATIVLALHEMPADVRPRALENLLRVARRVMAVDFAVPMPWNYAGLRSRVMELAAGPEHFSAFRDYSRRGGLPALAEQVGATEESRRTIDGNALQVMVLSGS